MTHTPARGDRAAGAVSPLLLIVVGLVVALVSGAFLVLQLRGHGGDTVAAATVSTAAAPSTPAATTTAEPTTGQEPTSEEPASDEPASAAPGPAEPADQGTARETFAAAPVAPQRRAPGPATEGAAPAPVPASPVEEPQAVASPAWISIAAGGVNGPLVPQGLAPDGTINPGRNQIIWFTGNGRVAPGQVGTAVIAGHVTWEGSPDAFVNLSSVGVGDVVTVGYADGTSRSYTVTSTQAVDKNVLAASEMVWGSHPDRPRLAIITCDPALGYQSDGHTEANFVVIAEA